MTGKPLDIVFKADAIPSAVHCPIPVPKVHLQHGVRAWWWPPKKMVQLGERWIYKNLNAATLRETHDTPTPFNHVSIVPPHTKKTVLDAWNGYHSLSLTPEARNATTFITEWGRYRYYRAPQRYFMPPVMAILVVLMILPLSSPIKHAVSMTVFYGTDPLKTVFGTHP